MKICFAILLLVLVAVPRGNAQSSSVDADVIGLNDGTLLITAKTVRPLQQIIDCVRHRYGWTVDSEEPPDPRIFQFARYVSTGNTFTVQFHEPVGNTPAEEMRVLRDIVKQYNALSQIQYRVIRVSSYRFDVVPVTGSVLDLPVKIDSATRSLSGEVDAILAALTVATGIKAERGGLIDNAMEMTSVSLNHEAAMPVRQWLEEALNSLPDQSCWDFGYEPGDRLFAIGIQRTAQFIQQPDGTASVKAFTNPSYKRLQR